MIFIIKFTSHLLKKTKKINKLLSSFRRDAFMVNYFTLKWSKFIKKIIIKNSEKNKKNKFYSKTFLKQKKTS
jgi:thiamine kinase-like enzyme